MKDLISKSCIAGTASFLIKNLVVEIIYYAGITTFEYHAEASTLVLSVSQRDTIYGVVLGLAIDFILTCWVALIIGYVLRTTGKDYSVLKGAIIGASSWLVIYGYFVHTGTLGLLKVYGISAGLTTLVLDTVSGVISAYVIYHKTNRDLKV